MKKRYQINLANDHAVCESNYLCLQQLMPDLESRDTRCFSVSLADVEQSYRVVIQVEERCRYTTFIHIIQEDCLSPWLEPPVMKVRIYHDVSMAEVISINGRKHFKSLYEYPNEAMYQCDEKAQLNRFLGEWLSHCLRFGLECGAAITPITEVIDTEL